MTKFDCKFWATHLFVQQFFTLTRRKDINIPHHWPFVRSVITIITAIFFSRETMLFLAATKQLYEWFIPAVCHTFFTMFPSSYHHEIFRSYYHGQKWCPCGRSRSQRSKEILTQIECFRTLNSSLNSLMAMKWCTKPEVVQERCPIVFQGHRSNFKVTGAKKLRFWPELSVSGL